jgi:hypothetical protein
VSPHPKLTTLGISLGGQPVKHRQGGRDRVGVACGGSATRAVRSAAEVNGGGGALVVRGGEEEVGMLQGGVGQLGVELIGVERGRRRMFHGEQKAAAGGDRRHTFGSRCGAQRNQLRGRRASRGRKETD